MWCLWAAPLLIGAPIDQLDEFTLNLLGNDEVLQVNQDPLCAQAQRLAKHGPMEVWGKRLEDGSLAVGLFNVGFEAAPFTLDWSDLAIRGPHKVRDLWRQEGPGHLGRLAEHDHRPARRRPSQADFAGVHRQAGDQRRVPHDDY